MAAIFLLPITVIVDRTVSKRLTFGLVGLIVGGYLGIVVFVLTGNPATLLILPGIMATVLLVLSNFEPPHHEKSAKPKKPSEPNLLFEYLKAKKRKVCPLIQFE